MLFYALPFEAIKSKTFVIAVCVVIVCIFWKAFCSLCGFMASLLGRRFYMFVSCLSLIYNNDKAECGDPRRISVHTYPFSIVRERSPETGRYNNRTFLDF